MSGVSRRGFVGAAAMAGAVALNAFGQTEKELTTGRENGSASDIGPKNLPLQQENPNSILPPFTDHGDPIATWYSFSLAHRRVQAGGWTSQVTERELPSSKEVAGVLMRLMPGAFRELHWHTANEWAIVLKGNTRVTIMQTDGKMFVDDVAAGDLWFFPAGLPHSIQALEDGTEFLLVFDDGSFSESATFLVSEALAHTPPDILKKNMGWSRSDFDTLPKTQLYIFPADLPESLEADQQFERAHLEKTNSYSFALSKMTPSFENRGGSVKIVDSVNFPASTTIASALVTLKPGAIRELHWHPDSSEWQYYLAGQGRMTVLSTGAVARTMDFRANDVGYVPKMATHYIENTGAEDLVFLEILKTPRFSDISVNEWIARMPDKLAQAHLKLPLSTIRSAPQQRSPIIAG